MAAPVIRRLELSGLRLASSQVCGNFRLVPVLRDEVPGDLRFARRRYDADVTFTVLDPRTFYAAYVPHALVMTWGREQVEAAAGAQLAKRDGKSFRFGPITARVMHRMARREDKNQLRMLPLHLAMEGFLALHFGGPTVAWSEYSREALSRGLSPRIEQSSSGWASAAFEEALRIFEIHEQQVGVLVFNNDLLLSGFVVSHPDDYRALHRALLSDFYGELLLQHGFLEEAPALGTSMDEGRVASLADLRAEVERLHAEQDEILAGLARGLVGVEVSASRVYDAGPFRLERFVTRLVPSEENHIGELILRDDGRLEHLHTYRLSAAQTRRAFLLQQLAEADWNLDAAAERLRCSRDELIVRLDRAGFGYLLKAHVLAEAWRRESRR